MENPAVFQSADLPGVQGTSNTNDGGGFRSTTAFGVFAASVSAAGLRAVSETGRGMEAQAKGGTAEGLVAQSEGGAGALGISNTGDGVVGKTVSGIGVFAVSVNAVGLRAVSENARALEATAKKGTGEGVVAQSDGGDGVFGISGTGIGVHGKGGKLAGLFEGDVKVEGNVDVTGDVRFSNADCAEDFDIEGLEFAEPGTVMVLNDAGELAASAQAYDKRVAGVVSGAGTYKPGIVLDRRATGIGRQPIGLLGKVFCKVDAQFRPITVGDLLTTSPTPGHAMATSDPFRSFGAVIGKALGPLAEGQGIIPILIALQ